MPDRYDHNLLIQSLRNLRPKSASLLGKIRNGSLNKKKELELLQGIVGPCLWPHATSF